MFMNLNNKGFAITGILYTVFVLFLMILLSVLGGLNIKRKLLEKNMEEIKSSIEEVCYDGDKLNLELPYKTKYSGKYVLDIGGNECVAYLSKGIDISNDTINSLNFINDDECSSTGGINGIVSICTTDDVDELNT